jgi:hypothetical protein
MAGVRVVEDLNFIRPIFFITFGHLGNELGPEGGIRIGFGALPNGGGVTPNPKLLCDERLATDGIRASGRQHPIQHRHADGSLGLLSRKAAGSQPWSD